MQIRDLVSDSQLMGRYSEYEIFVEEIEEKSWEELTAELEQAVEEKNIYYRVPWRHREKSPRYFIVPKKDATFQESRQNAFDFYPEILLDFIELAVRIREDRRDENAAKHILKFCNRYGLFNLSGLYSISFGKSTEVDFDGRDYSPYEYDWVMLKRPGMEALEAYFESEGSSSTIHTHTFVDVFIPESWRGYNKLIEDRDNLPKALMNNFYCEPVYFAKKEILELYLRFMEWFSFVENKDDPMVAKDRLSGYLMTNPINITVDYDKGWRLKWVYGNLIDALNVMFLHNIIEKNQKILFCENEYCKAPFIVRKDKQIYCSSHCRDAARFRRHYNKHKKKKQEEGE